MAIILPHIEDSNTTNYLPPKGEFEQFQNEDHYGEKVKEWGLSTAKGLKKEFWYKEKIHQRLVTIKGYETFGDTSEYDTLVVEFQDGNLSCIHPAYLKEMQSSNFGKEIKVQDEGSSPVSVVSETKQKIEAPETKAATSPKPKAPTTKKEKKEKPAKLVLPEEKVHFTGTVKQFALSWNHFNEENDEVIVLENVVIELEEPVEVGQVWCSHSKTMKKFELASGESLEFDGKIVKKSLPKGKDVEDEAFILEGPVPYKINNPSKIVKK